MTERHLIVLAILLLVALASLFFWRRGRRSRRAPEPHLRIDLLADDGEPPRPQA